MKVKARRDYMTRGCPAMGGFPAVPGERVRVTGFADVNGERWCRVRFSDGGRVLMHPNNLRPTGGDSPVDPVMREANEQALRFEREAIAGAFVRKALYPNSPEMQ